MAEEVNHWHGSPQIELDDVTDHLLDGHRAHRYHPVPYYASVITSYICRLLDLSNNKVSAWHFQTLITPIIHMWSAASASMMGTLPPGK